MRVRVEFRGAAKGTGFLTRDGWQRLGSSPSSMPALDQAGALGFQICYQLLRGFQVSHRSLLHYFGDQSEPRFSAPSPVPVRIPFSETNGRQSSPIGGRSVGGVYGAFGAFMLLVRSGRLVRRDVEIFALDIGRGDQRSWRQSRGPGDDARRAGRGDLSVVGVSVTAGNGDAVAQQRDKFGSGVVERAEDQLVERGRRGRQVGRVDGDAGERDAGLGPSLRERVVALVEEASRSSLRR
jgi:hypothetical protein